MMNIIEEAQRVLRIEAESLLRLAENLDDHFSDMIDCICRSTGRLILSGIGKSGIIAKKISATLNSTGTQSFFLHPVEALHGDLGLVSKEDILIALSYTGETDELNLLIPIVKEIGLKVIAFTGNENSTLGKQSDIVINVGVEKEACALGLAPTASSTALLAMGDAMAVVLSKKKHFDQKKFKQFHPGGALGQRLSHRVEDLMLKGPAVPSISIEDSMEKAIEEMDHKKLGTTVVIDRNNKLAGIITDGDLRRIIARKLNPQQLMVKEVMIFSPKHVFKKTPAFDALNMMEKFQITVLPVVDEDREVAGIIHLHDILGKGAFKFNHMA